MPRSPHNNPTERILRLLDEMEELSGAYDSLVELLAQRLSATEFESLPPKPRLEAFISELTRQKISGRQTLANRDSTRRSRMRKIISEQIKETS